MSDNELKTLEEVQGAVGAKSQEELGQKLRQMSPGEVYRLHQRTSRNVRPTLSAAFRSAD